MSPRDFLEDNHQNMSSPNTGMSAGSPRDFLPESEEQRESLGTSAALAIPRVLKDLGTGAYNAAQAIPSYLEKAKTEVPGLLSPFGQMNKHQIHAAGQALAGGNELINSIAQFPLNVSRYGSDRLNLIPHAVTNALQKITPEDTTQSINQLFGDPKYEGEAALRGGIRNLPIGIAAKGIAPTLNPMQLTDKHYIKSVLNARERAIQKFSGENGLYNELHEEAKSRGITGEHINPTEENLSILKKHMPEDEYAAIENMMKDKNSKTSQNAISQLGYRQRVLKAKSNRDILTDPEKELYKAVRETKDHIQENMFRDKNGKVHEDLVNKHKNIQTGYKNEVIPYTKNKAINAFLAKEKLPRELRSSLSKGKFAAQVGEFHQPSLPLRVIRKIVTNPLAKKSLGYLTGGALLGTGYEGYENLFGKKSHD